MECSIKNCIINRLLIALVSFVLAIGVAVLFALELLPLLFVAFPYTAALGGLLMVAVFASIVSISSGCGNRSCMLCLGLMALIASAALLLFSLVGLAVCVLPFGLLSIALVFFLALAFWIALISFVAYARCLAYRPHA